MAFTRIATRQALLLSLLLGCSVARAQLPTPPAHYEIEARLDPDAHRVHGQLRVRFTAGPTPLQEIWLQLYANGLRDRHSVYQQGRALAARERGSLVLGSLRVQGAQRLDDAQQELLPGDFTRLRLPLETAIAPGESVTLEAEFVTTLPALGSRSGHAEDFHLVAQWYPKLAYRTPDGQFAAHVFERQAEFRANHASYDLTVRAPEGFVVEAAGARIDLDEAGAWRFQAGPATDVAFVACRHCGTRRETRGDTTVRALFAPGAEEAAARQREVVLRGLAYLGEQLAPYPYAQLVLVTPPRGSPVAGMEYPGFVVLPPGPSPVRSHAFVDGRHVAAHELAHQWFYGLVSSDEVRFPVLDEGLTEWAACDLLGQLDGTAPLGLDCFDLLRAGTQVGKPPPPPAGLPAHGYDPAAYGRAVYARAALALESVRRSHGDARFRRALSRYVERNRFAVASPQDLESAFDDAYAPGFFARTLGPLLFDGARSEVHLGSVRTHATEGGFETRVRAHRSGAVELPTWLELRDDDGHVTRIPWPQARRTLEIAVRGVRPPVAVQLDPDRALLVDGDRFDQRWRRQRGASDGLWTNLLFTWAQGLLGWLGP